MEVLRINVLRALLINIYLVGNVLNAIIRGNIYFFMQKFTFKKKNKYFIMKK